MIMKIWTHIFQLFLDCTFWKRGKQITRWEKMLLMNVGRHLLWYKSWCNFACISSAYKMINYKIWSATISHRREYFKFNILVNNCLVKIICHKNDFSSENMNVRCYFLFRHSSLTHTRHVVPVSWVVWTFSYHSINME